MAERARENMVAELFNIEVDVPLIWKGAGLQATTHKRAAS